MRTIDLQDMVRGSEFVNVRSCLDAGGLICLPCRSSYRILADLTNPKAVNNLLLSKHRTAKAPSLVFIPDHTMLKQVASHIPPQAKLLAKTLWPGELTIRLDPNEDNLPAQIVKPLTKVGGKLGVRVPSESWILKLLKDLNRPLLVSSANREKKHGSSSPALIQKNFSNHIDIFVQAGDIPESIPSTVIEFIDGNLHVKREGAVLTQRINALLNAMPENYE